MTVAGQIARTEMCGGCGNADPAKRCIGCQHDFNPTAPSGPEQITDERLSELLARLPPDLTYGFSRGAGMEPSATALKTSEARSILTELQHRREAEAGPQCCMCGKTGLSTVEGDGGQECELDDGRWVCSGECWDRAIAASPSSPASGKALEWAVDEATNEPRAKSVFGLHAIWFAPTGWYWQSPWHDKGYGPMHSEGEAKSAAQADYEARIRSALKDTTHAE